MTIYLVLIIIILFERLFKMVFGSSKYKLIYCTIVGLCLLLVMGLRSETLGSWDTQWVYKETFHTISEHNISEMIPYLKETSSGHLFYIITWIFSLVCKNYNAYLFFMSVPFVATAVHFIYKYSCNLSLSFIVFITFYFGSYFTLVRQSLAVALLLFSFDCLIKGNYKRYILLVITASLIHSTAIVLLLLLLFIKAKYIYMNYCIPLIALAICAVAPQLFYEVLNFAVKNETYVNRYLNSETINLGYSGFIINMSILIFLAIYFRNKKNEKKFSGSKIMIKEDFYLWNATVATALYSFATLIGEFFRISMYFGMFSIISIPEAVLKEKNKKIRFMVKMFLYFILIAYFLIYELANRNISPYIFYWQE